MHGGSLATMRSMAGVCLQRGGGLRHPTICSGKPWGKGRLGQAALTPRPVHRWRRRNRVGAPSTEVAVWGLGFKGDHG
jgi:hypothetical protein